MRMKRKRALHHLNYVWKKGTHRDTVWSIYTLCWSYCLLSFKLYSLVMGKRAIKKNRLINTSRIGGLLAADQVLRPAAFHELKSYIPFLVAKNEMAYLLVWHGGGRVTKVTYSNPLCHIGFQGYRT